MDEEHEVDIDEFVELELSVLQIAPISIGELSDLGGREELSDAASGAVLEGEYSAESRGIARYLTTLKKPVGLSVKDFRKFKNKALQFQVQDRTLFRRARKNTPQTRVVDSKEERALILRRLYNETGHKGRESTY